MYVCNVYWCHVCSLKTHSDQIFRECFFLQRFLYETQSELGLFQSSQWVWRTLKGQKKRQLQALKTAEEKYRLTWISVADVRLSFPRADDKSTKLKTPNSWLFSNLKVPLLFFLCFWQKVLRFGSQAGKISDHNETKPPYHVLSTKQPQIAAQQCYAKHPGI